MGTTKISRTRSILQALRSVSKSLPSAEERSEMQSSLQNLSAYLDYVQKEITRIPVREDVAALLETVDRLDLLLQRAEANPVTARALGVEKRLSGITRKTEIKIDQTRVDELLGRFKSMTIDQIREALRNDSFCSLPELRMLATTLGVRAVSRIRRDGLTQKILTQIANSRTYESLSNREESDQL